MKVPWCLVAALLAFSSFAVAQLPNCAVTCLGAALPSSSCAPTDQACICADAQLNAQLAQCVQTTCTVKETLTTLNYTSTACGAPIRSKTNQYRVIAAVFFTLANLFILVRFIPIIAFGAPFTAGDAVLLVLLFLNATIHFLQFYGIIGNGIGQDMWKLSFDSITTILFYFWLCEFVYFPMISLLKIAFLLFFLRIFPEKRIRHILWGLVVINALVGAAFMIAVSLVCRPLSFTWKQWDGEHSGTCGNMNALVFANAGFSIFLDICTLILPLTQIWHLQLGLKKKIGVTIMFSIGAFVTIVSMLRLKALTTFAKSTNPTWDYFESGVWSSIELNVGLICVCLPSFRLLLIRMFHSLGSTNDSNNRSGLGKSSLNRTHTSKPRNNDGGIGGISLSKNFVVEYTTKPGQDQASFVQLVDIQAVRQDSRDS